MSFKYIYRFNKAKRKDLCWKMSRRLYCRCAALLYMNEGVRDVRLASQPMNMHAGHIESHKMICWYI